MTSRKIAIPIPQNDAALAEGLSSPTRLRATTDPLFRSGTPGSPLPSSESLLRRLESLSTPSIDGTTVPHLRSRTASAGEEGLGALNWNGNGPERRPSTSLSLSYTALELREIAREIKNVEVDLGGAQQRQRLVLVAGVRSRSEAKQLIQWLIASVPEIDIHVSAALAPELSELLPKDSRSTITGFPPSQPINATLPSPADLVISIGGDGTALRAAWLFQGEMPPLLAFRTDVSRSEGVAWQGRSRGVLAVHLWKNWKPTLARIFGRAAAGADSEKTSPDGDKDTSSFAPFSTGGYRILFRTRLSCTVIRCAATAKMLKEGVPGAIPRRRSLCEDQPAAAKDKETYHILNELIVDRGTSPYLSLLELRISTEDSGERSTLIQADGVVIATPTGSTAYSLSAGGSVVHSDVGAILITPIAPHELTLRPFILPDTTDLRLLVPSEARSPAWASFDSRARVPLYPGDEVLVSASTFPIPSVCPDEDTTRGWNFSTPSTEPVRGGPRRASLTAEESDESDGEGHSPHPAGRTEVDPSPRPEDAFDADPDEELEQGHLRTHYLDVPEAVESLGVYKGN